RRHRPSIPESSTRLPAQLPMRRFRRLPLLPVRVRPNPRRRLTDPPAGLQSPKDAHAQAKQPAPTDARLRFRRRHRIVSRFVPFVFSLDYAGIVLRMEKNLPGIGSRCDQLDAELRIDERASRLAGALGPILS